MVEITKININNITPSPYNPRIMQENELLKLQQNMKTFGLVDPIIINLKNNHIIGGHQRFTILQEKYSYEDEPITLPMIQLGDIGWVFEEEKLSIQDDNHEKALNLSLNRLSGEFDKDALNKLFTELEEEDFLLDLTGFDDYEIIEYSLEDSELDIFKHENTSFDDSEELLDFTDGTTDTTEYININFNTSEQRTRFIQLIMKLKEENPDKQISTALIEYLESQYTEPQPRPERYTILFKDTI